jgi:hypothetical protein
MENSLLSFVLGALISGGVLGALIGVFLGHRLAVSLFRERSKALENAFYNDFYILKDDLISWFPALLEEYRGPLKLSYSGPAPLDLKLIENLIVELAGTDRMISPDQRRLVSRMERSIEGIKKKDKTRDIYIKRWLENEEELNGSEKHDISSHISFITAQLLVDVSQGIYFLDKVLSERKKFAISDDSSILTFMKHACSATNSNFDREECSAIVSRLKLG